MTTTQDRSPQGDATARRAELLARRLRAARTADRRATIPRRPEGSGPPLSFAQERLWFMDQFVPDSTAYTVPQVVRVRGPLDPARLGRALERVAARHESLRMRFPAGADGSPQVVVEAESGITLRTRVLAGPDGTSRDEELRQLVREETARVFDLAHGPVLHACVVATGSGDGAYGADDNEHVLVLVHHHIVSDGWSSELFLRELFAAYREDAPTAPEDVIELPVRYGDFAAWQRARYQGDVLRADLDHWRGRLAGVPPLDLPTDLPRPTEPTLRGAGHGLAVGPELSRDLLALGASRGATPYMTLLAAYQAVLLRWCGQEDFAVGSTVAGRALPELEPMVGLFANVLALRADVGGDPGFGTLLDRVRQRFLADLEHQEMPFEQLVGELALPRDPGRTPVFQTSFTLLSYDRPTEQATGLPGGPDGGPVVEHFPFEITSTRFDLELYLRQTPDGLHGFFTYSTGLFLPGTISRLSTLFLSLLRQAVRHPDVPLSRLDLVDEDERRLLLAAGNPSEVEVEGPHTLLGRIEARAARTPDQVCLVVDETSERLTYRHIDDRARILAGRLREYGVGPDTVVAVCAERSAELLPALLGVLKAGGAYLPLDPDHPAERLAFMLADAAPPVVLTQRAARDRLPATAPAGTVVLDLDDPGLWTERTGADGVREPLPQISPDQAAYVIYTSGSTGRPKGVVNTHRGIHNRLDWMQRAYPLGPDDAVLQKTPTGFDVSVWELFWPLREGAVLVLARPGGHRDAGYLRDAVVRHSVTTVHFVPSMLAVLLAEDDVEHCTSLRRVICSGEELPADLARRLLATLDCELHNLYGPTEAAVDCTAWTCTATALAGLRRTPIGRPIQNMGVRLLDAHGALVPVGLAGELHITGPGVARGYLNRPELTVEKFLPDPYGPPGARMYASGDLARYRDDGTLDYLGRTDQQVKLHGLRIEPGEIEAALRGVPGIGEAAVVVREDRPGDRRLVAYLVGTVPPPDELRVALRRTLPDSMLPSGYVTLDALPLSPNGKLDRRALPAPTAVLASGVRQEPATPAEQAVAEVWADILGIGLPGRADDFFALGGHSLLGIRVVARLRKALPEAGTMTLMDLFKHPTVQGLAELLDTPAAERGPARVLHELTPPRQGGTAARRLTLVCVPYGGGSAVVYQPLADELPPDCGLFALSGTGEEMGRSGRRGPLPELVAAAVAEIQERVDGPVAVYGHCGVGGALAVALGRALEAAGREVETVFVGAVFPFARPRGRAVRMMSGLERFASHRRYVDWLTSLGVSLDDVGPEQARRLVQDMRADSEEAEEYFTGLLRENVAPLAAPVVSVVGERDEITAYHEERFREWHFVTGRTALVVLKEAGHYFLKYRAAEMAEIVTGPLTPPADGTEAPDGRTWWVAGASDTVDEGGAAGAGDGAAAVAPAVRAERSERTARIERSARSSPEPSMPRFLAVAAGQLVSMTGTALTEFALPLWLYLTSHSLLQLALLASLGLVPGLLVAPLAGAVADRYSRRRVMLVADAAAGAVQGTMLILLLAGELGRPAVYTLLTMGSVALTFQRIAYNCALPQLVPKRYLGHANGLVQAGSGIVQFAVPLVATAALATVGLRGILLVDVGSYGVALAVTGALRFPERLGWRRREGVIAEIRAGFRLSVRTPGFRAMLLFFAGTNLLVGPLFIFFQPLVLGFGTLADVARVSLAGGLGIALGGLLMAVWGGPSRHRMRGVLLAFLGMAAACALTGLRPSLPLVALGVFGMFLGLTVMNTIYATIIQVKVPARFHGRVFAVNSVFAWSTMPVGFVLLGPIAAGASQHALAPGGALAGILGPVVGTGPGRGLGLTYVVFGLVLVLVALVARRVRVLRTFDAEVPDARPDDLVGLDALRADAPELVPVLAQA